MSVFTNYLEDKQKEQVKLKVYLNSTTMSKGKEVHRMLEGYIVDFDEETLRLDEEECIIERNAIMSAKPARPRNH